jgi:PTS system N-acetylglucosamine-specific IIC component
MALLYFVVGYTLLKYLKIDLFKEMEEEETEKPSNDASEESEAARFIEALGGAENILDTDACITRLRMQVRESAGLEDSAFLALGASGVIRPDASSIQIVLGPKAEKIADQIKKRLGEHTASP